MWRTASSKRCSIRASSPSIASRRTCEPRVVDRRAASARPGRGPRRRARGRRPRSRPATAKSAVRGLVPRPVQPVVERVGCDRSAPAPAPTRRGARRRRRGSSSSAPAGRRRRSPRPARWRRRRARGRARGGRSTPRSTPRAAARAARSRAGAASPAASSAARIRCAPRLSPRTIQAQPNPLTMSSASSGSCVGAPGQGGVDVRALGAGEREVLGLAGAAHARGRGPRPRRRTTRRARRGRARSARPPPSPRARTRGCCRAAGSGRRVVVDDHERAAREPADHVDRRRRGHVERLEHGLDRGERRAAGERGQRPQAPLVVGEQQLVAPPDRRLAARGGAPACGWSGRSAR